MKKISLLMALILTIALATAINAQDKTPECMSDVKPGEWVLYELPSSIQQKHTVLDVTDGVATVQIQTLMNGKVISDIEQKVVLSDLADRSASFSPKVYAGETEVKDQKIKCTVVEADVQGRVSKTYMSNDIPVMGIILSEYDGNPAMKLIDYGFEPQTEPDNE
ncbi:hypothetical protein J7L67_01210 [bacterium]|nr:hypothetical protein [bacterium]